MKKQPVLFASLIILGNLLLSVTADEPQQHVIQQKSSITCTSSSSCWPSPEEWEDLDQAVNGNLVTVVPPGQSCYSGTNYNKNTCKIYQKGFLFDLHRESHIGTMQNINWETCGDEGGCLLNSIFPSMPQLFGKCGQGALPRYALNSTSEEEIATVIKFAQDRHIAFNIKNSGHDYLGRSTSPDSITIWTHPLQKIEFHDFFKPEKCDHVDSQKAFTFGGGVKWFDAYQAANKHNVTVIGGAQAGVSVAGGWLGGGGHSMLTPAFGLGVDQVLQYKIVLANGELVTVNKCQHSDLFWALRGGGGGSFGVVTEVTMKVHPYVDIQVYGIEIIALLPGAKKSLLMEFARHSERWAEEGWGGYAYYYGVGGLRLLYGNPLMTPEEAAESMKPFLDFINSKPLTYIKKRVEKGTSHGFYELFTHVMHPNAEMVGYGARIASRLIPREHFATNKTIEVLIDAFLEGTKLTRPSSLVLPTQILATTSLRVKDEQKETSVQPLFRSTVWHVIYTGGWIQGFPEFLKRQTANKVSKAIDPIRKITPGGGAYLNEADVLEPDWRQSFWGDNYKRLTEIKNKYDPTNFFHCWKCIGWNEEMITSDKKYRCYQY